MEKLKEDNFIVHVCGNEINASPQIRIIQATFIGKDNLVERPLYYNPQPMSYSFTKRLTYYRVITRRVDVACSKKRENIYKPLKPIVKNDTIDLRELRRQRYQENKEYLRANNLWPFVRKGATHTAEARAKISAANKGKTVSEETREKMTAAMKKRHEERRIADASSGEIV